VPVFVAHIFVNTIHELLGGKGNRFNVDYLVVLFIYLQNMCIFVISFIH